VLGILVGGNTGEPNYVYSCGVKYARDKTLRLEDVKSDTPYFKKT
jgi:hypothetical protein